MIKEYEYLIRKILSKVPRNIREDCRQAAYVGMLNALKKKDKIRHIKSYIYACMKNEVTEEVARLRGPGNGIYSLDKITFLLYCEYKRRKGVGLSIEDMKLTKSRVAQFEKMLVSRRFSYSENPYGDWIDGMWTI